MTPPLVIVSAAMLGRHRLESLLDGQGFLVVGVDSVRAGLLLAVTVGADLIVAQLCFSDMTAAQFAHEVHCRAITIPTILVTDESAEQTLHRREPGVIPPHVRLHELTKAAAHAVQKAIIVDARVLAALKLIAERYAETQFSLGRAAREVGVAHEYLCRLFKRETGRTFLAHLREFRVRQAERLLLDSSLSIKEIAVQTGFGNTSHLDRCFHRVRPGSPSDYRRHGGSVRHAMSVRLPANEVRSSTFSLGSAQTLALAGDISLSRTRGALDTPSKTRANVDATT